MRDEYIWRGMNGMEVKEFQGLLLEEGEKMARKETKKKKKTKIIVISGMVFNYFDSEVAKGC